MVRVPKIGVSGTFPKFSGDLNLPTLFRTNLNHINEKLMRKYTTNMLKVDISAMTSIFPSNITSSMDIKVTVKIEK